MDGEIDIYPLFDGPPQIGIWAEIATVKDAHGEGLDDGPYECACTEANANLIASAPEMLAALKLAHEALGANAARDFVDAAIAKAEGRA
ncbi:hypothetical protein [Xanthobacter agilis]|uniref:Uncharacterized protein n=1 Tax=Xanthobacter agilis TaxID=47492 RepID=A0ABU0LFR3_XANAG|nr:hypothetical protein [Xanthobacter agilis]MDQ0505989.1 hypothetical protein [Xanthobacter agilis]